MNVVVFDIRLNLRTNISELILGNYFKKKVYLHFDFYILSARSVRVLYITKSECLFLKVFF